MAHRTRREYASQSIANAAASFEAIKFLVTNPAAKEVLEAREKAIKELLKKVNGKEGE